VVTTQLTATDLERMDAAGEQLELLNGDLLEAESVSFEHGLVAFRLPFYVYAFALQHRLGEVLSSDTQYWVTAHGLNVFRPHAGFIANDRLPVGEMRKRVCQFPPDLAIDVVSPANTESDILRKISIYLDGGTRSVWLVRPEQQTITVFTPENPERILTAADTLEGGEVLPGFTLPLSELFA
jgi:Uma2 family endonuclease